MKVLVAYMSSTGNTRKVAEAIFDEITVDKEIKPINEIQDLNDYDLSFLGFPTHQYGPDKKTKAIITKLCTKGNKVAMFVTHGAPENGPEAQEWMTRFKEAASMADLVGFFDCQGQLSKEVKIIMRLSTQKKLREWARIDDSQGQPDETRLAKARSFARDVMGSISHS